MPVDDHLMTRADEVLRQEPLWEPPAGFIARMAVLRPETVQPPRAGYLTAFLYGTVLTIAAIAAGYAVAPVYEMFVNAAMKTLVMNATVVAWICLGAMVLTAYLFPSIWSPESDVV